MTLTLSVLRELCDLVGVSGREDAVRRYILDKIESSSAPHEVTTDRMGNVLVHMIGKNRSSKKLLLDAHMDEVGIIISHIHDDGTLSFETVGGIDKGALFGHLVQIGDRIGVIGGKAVHQCRDEEKETVPPTESMTIDIGYSANSPSVSDIRVGDVGTFLGEFSQWGNGFIKGKAIDNRFGCAILLELAQTQPLYDVWLSFSVQEEVGLRGAGVVGESVRPDIAIAIDATTASDIAGCAEKDVVCRVGNGAVVSFADKATLYDEDLYREIRELAENNGIMTQTKTRIAGGNNAGALQRSYHGVRVAAISLPCRYLHSSSCVANIKDAEAIEALLRVLIERLPS